MEKDDVERLDRAVGSLVVKREVSVTFKKLDQNCLKRKSDGIPSDLFIGKFPSFFKLQIRKSRWLSVPLNKQHLAVGGEGPVFLCNECF